MITNRRLFKIVDGHRKTAGLSIRDTAEVCDVSEVTYKNWRKGVVPDAHREAMLKVIADAILICIGMRELPIKGRTVAIREQRKEFLDIAVAELKAKNRTKGLTVWGETINYREGGPRRGY